MAIVYGHAFYVSGVNNANLPKCYCFFPGKFLYLSYFKDTSQNETYPVLAKLQTKIIIDSDNATSDLV